MLSKSTNQKCDALASYLGFFLHTNKAPERVIDVFHRAGISLSTRGINKMIHSLSKEANRSLVALAKTHWFAFGYDNFDITKGTSMTNVDGGNGGSGEQYHLTSATAIPLMHGNPEALKKSEELWDRSPLNPDAKADDIECERTFEDFLGLRKTYEDDSGLTASQHFQRWKFCNDLVHHGPEYFRQFTAELGEPEILEGIPVSKTEQVPARAMDIAESTVQGNADVITNLHSQANIGDPQETPGVVDRTGRVLIVHGDLATGERIYSLQVSRSIEKTPWRRMQFVIFVFGLFHLKMACADAIWRILLRPKASHEDPGSLMELVSALWPKLTGKMGSKPTFRQMHECIKLVGIAMRMDALRVASGYESLDDFAKSKPTWSRILELTGRCVQDNVANDDFSSRNCNERSERDIQHENSRLQHLYFLLYEELSHAMDAGDVGRVESCLFPWIFIFRACGKNKYASHTMKFISDLYFLYDDELRCVLQ